ncbi:MAG: hypothetical protein HC781_14225 [Leptolyngbyaceae cyanobacterium CSU_1_4]|nr:hypothetical protein [Leptolyngbyaceae cyanobacterium CSU_1_4]
MARLNLLHRPPPSSSSAQSVVVGTAGYMPNEQQSGRSRFSSDLYALGMVVIQCITGIHPRDLKEDSKTGEIQWKSQIELHPQLRRIVEKMVKVRLRDRYLSATDVLIDLDKFEQAQTNPQLPAQLMYGSVIFLLLLGGFIGVWQPLAGLSKRSPPPDSSAELSPQPPIGAENPQPLHPRHHPGSSSAATPVVIPPALTTETPDTEIKA